jgi:nitrogen fixation/metabolism regulation signal transduction histidine kinase
MGVFDIAKRTAGALNPASAEANFQKPGTANMGRSTQDASPNMSAVLSGQAGTPKGYQDTTQSLAMKAQAQKKKQVEAFKAKKKHDKEVRVATAMAESKDEKNDPTAGHRAALEKE